MVGTTLYIALLTVALGVDNRGHYHKVTDQELLGCEIIVENQSEIEISPPHFESAQEKVRREWLFIHSSFGAYRWIQLLKWSLTTTFPNVVYRDDHQLYSRKERPDT